MRVSHWPVVAQTLVCIIAIACCIAPGACDTGAAQDDSVVLEGLLKEAGLDYIKTSDGFYKVIVTLDDETTLIFAKEEALAGLPDVKLAYLYTRVVQMSEDVKPSRAMLQKMAELNGSLLVGNLSLEGNAVYYNSSFWLNNADADTLAIEFALAHMIRSGARSELLPFVEEE